MDNKQLERSQYKLKELSKQFSYGFLTDNGISVFWSKSQPVMNTEGTRVIPPNDIFVDLNLKDYQHTDCSHPIVISCGSNKIDELARNTNYTNPEGYMFDYEILNKAKHCIGLMTKGSVIFVIPCNYRCDKLDDKTCKKVEESWNSQDDAEWTATYIPDTGLLRLIHK